MFDFLNQFGNREIAILIWVAVIVFLMLLKGNLRKSMGGVVKAFFQPPLLKVFFSALVYIGLTVWLLHWRDIWTAENLKSTIAWTLTFAFLAMFEANRIAEDERYFTKILRDLLSITAIFIFIIELHSFSLLTELIAVPIISFVALLHALSETQKEHAQVEKFLGWTVAIIGFTYLGISIWKTVENFETLATVDTLREFLIPILLSVLFLPFLFGLGLYMVYESIFVSMGVWMEDKRLLRYAKRHAIFRCRSNFDYLKRWSRHVQRERPETRQAMKETFAYVRTVLDRERNPPVVSKEQGWSPWDAKDFMTEFGLETRDYRQGYEGDWFAESSFKQIGRGYPQNNLYYNVDGTAECANTLRLKLNLNDLENEAEATAVFSEAVKALIEKASGDAPSKSLTRKIELMEDFDKKLGLYKLSLKRDDWSRGTQQAYDLDFTIAIDDQP